MRSRPEPVVAVIRIRVRPASRPTAPARKAPSCLRAIIPRPRPLVRPGARPDAVSTIESLPAGAG